MENELEGLTANVVGPFFMVLWGFWVNDDSIGNEGSSRLGYEYFMMGIVRY
jgi:hypothetical protein